MIMRNRSTFVYFYYGWADSVSQVVNHWKH